MEPTFEQCRVVRELRLQYGREDTLMISLNDMRIVRMIWRHGLGEQPRMLFILANGQRMAFKEITV